MKNIIDKIQLHNASGFALIEILVVIAIISLVVVSASRAAIMVKQTEQASADRSQALSYAQEWLEVISAIKNKAFACVCHADGCSCSQDGDNCTALPKYQSCWTDYPKNWPGVTDFKLVDDAGGWHLADLGGSPDPCPDPRFSRKLTITNLAWNADGEIAATGGTVDPNTKEAVVTVDYQSDGAQHEVSLHSILTAWQNVD